MQKGVAFFLLSLPLLWLAEAMVAEVMSPGSRLGADPGEAVVQHLGIWSLRMLLLTLCVSTVRRLASWPYVMRLRRMIGLFAFSYVVLHFLAYLGLLAELDWWIIGEDLVERPYITVGFLALVGLVPLAVTSTNGWRRRLGRSWLKLHRLIYPVTVLALTHFLWLIKDGYGEALIYVAVFAGLMAERLLDHRARALRTSSVGR